MSRGWNTLSCVLQMSFFFDTISDWKNSFLYDTFPTAKSQISRTQLVSRTYTYTISVNSANFCTWRVSQGATRTRDHSAPIQPSHCNTLSAVHSNISIQLSLSLSLSTSIKGWKGQIGLRARAMGLYCTALQLRNDYYLPRWKRLRYNAPSPPPPTAPSAYTFVLRVYIREQGKERVKKVEGKNNKKRVCEREREREREKEKIHIRRGLWIGVSRSLCRARVCRINSHSKASLSF